MKHGTSYRLTKTTNERREDKLMNTIERKLVTGLKQNGGKMSKKVVQEIIGDPEVRKAAKANISGK